LRFTTRKFNIIYADPPWPYRDKNKSGNRQLKYPSMTIDELLKLPVPKISKPDSVCLMWVTAPLMNEGLEVMKGWGFDYSTIAFVWIKTNKKADTFFWGMGNSTRANAEFVLLGKKGKLPRVNAGVHSVVMERIQEHSKKPNEIRNRIIKLYGKKPRIELFARQNIRGWNSWGNDSKLLS
jgi:N6-adenosine-specific RNA methylase IME4